jgi:hypothetical protein
MLIKKQLIMISNVNITSLFTGAFSRHYGGFFSLFAGREVSLGRRPGNVSNGRECVG